MSKAIISFRGQHRWLSNFYPSPVTLDELVYPTVEHAFQAAKTTRPFEREVIRRMRSPADAKAMGRRVELRPQWEDTKLGVMDMLLRRKFNIPSIGRFLLATGDVQLIEGNTWGDTYWGVCRGRGENHLGKLIMNIRDELRAKS